MLMEQVFVIDSADRKRLEEGGLELKELLAERKLMNIPLMVLANKQDLMTALKPQEVHILFKILLVIDCGDFRAS